MWFKEYRDYPIDRPLIKEQVEPGHGIIGCEMHELNGWGSDYHDVYWQKKSLMKRWFSFLWRKK